MMNIQSAQKLFAFTSLLMLSGVARGDEYKLIFVNDRQINLIDETSISEDGKGMYKVWVIGVREKHNFLKGKVAVIKSHSMIQCDTRREKVISSVFYDRNQRELFRIEDSNDQYHDWVPDTVTAAQGQFVCDQQSRQKNYTFSGMTLGQIVKSIYSGPWPLKK
jgi:hypothetical protein